MQFFGNPAQRAAAPGGGKLFSEQRDAALWMPARGAFSYRLHAPAHKNERYVGVIRGPIKDPEAAIALFAKVDAAGQRDARRRGILSHELFIKMNPPGDASPLELLGGLDVWADFDGMTEHYADKNAMNALGAAFAGMPNASVWEQRRRSVVGVVGDGQRAAKGAAPSARNGPSPVARRLSPVLRGRDAWLARRRHALGARVSARQRAPSQRRAVITEPTPGRQTMSSSSTYSSACAQLRRATCPSVGPQQIARSCTAGRGSSTTVSASCPPPRATRWLPSEKAQAPTYHMSSGRQPGVAREGEAARSSASVTSREPRQRRRTSRKRRGARTAAPASRGSSSRAGVALVIPATAECKRAKPCAAVRACACGAWDSVRATRKAAPLATTDAEFRGPSCDRRSVDGRTPSSSAAPPGPRQSGRRHAPAAATMLSQLRARADRTR